MKRKWFSVEEVLSERSKAFEAGFIMREYTQDAGRSLAQCQQFFNALPVMGIEYKDIRKFVFETRRFKKKAVRK